MYKIYITKYDEGNKLFAPRELLSTYNDLRVLKNRAISDIILYMKDNRLKTNGQWDFAIFKEIDGNEVEFGNKDILFLILHAE